MSSGEEPLGRAQVKVAITVTCITCGSKFSGFQSAFIACRIDDSASKYPLHTYDFVRKSYGDGWNARSEGRRLTEEERGNPSTVRGWADAQVHSDARGGKAPPKGWGHAISKKYLRSEAACHHLKMISLTELNT